MRKQINTIALILLALLMGSSLSYATKDFYIKNNSQSYLYVNGTTGNVGIGSVTPGQILDVQGTVRTTGFVMSGQTPMGGYVLTALNSTGNTTWTSAGGVSGWTISGNNVYETNGGNVGIGSTTPGQSLDVQGTVRSVAFTTIGGYTQTGVLANAFTGTSTFSNATISALFTNGNVGIGSATPGQNLDVQGTVRTTGFVMSGQTPMGGYVLTALDSTGNTTWSSAGGVSGWTVSGNNVYETNSGNVGIGSTTPGQKLDVQGTVRMTGLTLTGNGAANGYVMVGNSIGVGTWMPVSTLGAGGTPASPTNSIQYNNSGSFGGVATFVYTGTNVGIGSASPGQMLDVQGTVRITAASAFNPTLLIPTGYVGIGSATPGQNLDVQGTVRTTGFVMSGQTPMGGYVLTALNSTGNTTWSSAGGVAGWTVSGNNVYETNSGNVGIGTTAVNQGALVVMNGNVGIGTWAPAAPLDVETSGNSYFGGNVGIGTINPVDVLQVVGTAQMTGFQLGTSTTSGYVLTANASGVGSWAAAGGGSPGSPTNSVQYNSSGSFTGSASFIYTGTNVGIGSATPGQILDVQGTVRTTGFTMSGQTPMGGYVLTAIDSTGSTTWSSAGGVSGWTVSGNNVYETKGGNVGIGSTAPGAMLDVDGSIRATDIFFPSEVTNGTCNNSTVTINWNSGNKQEVIIGPPTCNIAFTAPNGGAAANSLLLRVVQDSTGSRVVNSWTASPKWAGGSAPTLSTGIGAVDIITCYYNGTNYYCASTLNFS